MITPENGAQWLETRYWRPVTLFGLSTDVKPTENIANGSVFIEMDTSKVYFFDVDSTTWLEWGAESAPTSEEVEEAVPEEAEEEMPEEADTEKGEGE